MHYIWQLGCHKHIVFGSRFRGDIFNVQNHRPAGLFALVRWIAGLCFNAPFQEESKERICDMQFLIFLIPIYDGC